MASATVNIIRVAIIQHAYSLDWDNRQMWRQLRNKLEFKNLFLNSTLTLHPALWAMDVIFFRYSCICSGFRSNMNLDN